METQQSPKIRFYVQRPFGEKMNASFDFLKENFKVIFKYVTYLILPLCLIQGLTINSFMGSYMNIFVGGDVTDLNVDNFGIAFWINYGVTVLLYMIGYLLMTALITALIKLYNDREERLNGLTFGMLKPVLFRNMGRMFLLGILFYILMIIMVAVLTFLAGITLFTLFLTIPAFIAFMIAMTMWLPVYLFEKISIDRSFTKALRLGFATWGGVFAILFIMGIIASVLQGVVTTPYYVAVVVKTLFVYSSDSAASEPSIIYNFFAYILGVIFVFGIYLSTIFSILGLSYQYSHATEKLDSITVEDDIDNFENL